MHQQVPELHESPLEDEVLLAPDDQRFILFPIKDHDIYQMYKKQLSCFWRPEEIDFARDANDWATLSPDEKHFICMILAFFAASDGIVNENLALRFYKDVQLAEARAFYAFQLAMETIHSETYSLLIDTYIRDSEEKSRLFHSLDNFPCILKKAQWAQKWISDPTAPFAARLVAFACVEGIHFSGAFASIFWLKKRGLMQGLTFSNELISRDEALHTEFAVLLYQKLTHKLGAVELREIIEEAVDIETEFMCDALPCRLIGMNVSLMAQYIRFVADRLSIQLGGKKIYDAGNPFSFMELISMEQKTNFFESRVSEYALATKDGGASEEVLSRQNWDELEENNF